MEMNDQLINKLAQVALRIEKGQLDNEVLQRAEAENRWFTQDNIQLALRAIGSEYLKEDRVRTWLRSYPGRAEPKKVAMVLAGNIPAVGFHDVLCGLLSGHRLQIKLSSKDRILIPYLLSLIAPEEGSFEFVERLKKPEAVIATGSDSGVDHYRQYLGHLPHIFRGHRNSVAVLSGEESDKELEALMDDIFSYFGLGCRNVSKLMVPEDYDFTTFLGIAESTYKNVLYHHKYANNYDYNKTLLLMNKVPHHSAWNLLLSEDISLHSRIACLHYETYAGEAELARALKRDKENIQCIVSSFDIDQWDTFQFGKAQTPSLGDYADNIDTMAFLTDPA
jgi:hypothetical protein